MASRNARMDIEAEYTYLEDYDDQWEELPEIYENGSSEEFERKKELLESAVAEDFVEAVEEKMQRDVENVSSGQK